MSSSEVPGPNDPILLERLLLDLLDPDLKGHALFELCKKNIVFLHLHIHPHPLDLSMSLPSSPSLARGGKVGTEVVQAPVDQKMTSVEHLVLNLCDPTLRDRSLEELSKKKEMFPDLAPLLWYSFGTIAVLVQEILRIYPALSPPTLTSAASTRVCNVLALFQCIATRPETRSPFIKADILSYLHPFLRTVDKAQPFELLRVATLGVIGALVKDENTEATEYLLQCETIPLCLNIMEIGNEPSKTVSTFILLKVLRNELGLHRCCDIHGPFYAIAFALQERVNSLDERPSARLLKCIIQCYIRLFDNPRGRAVLKTNLPIALRDGTFNGDLMEDPSAQECLQQLLAAFRRWKDNAIMP